MQRQLNFIDAVYDALGKPSCATVDNDAVSVVDENALLEEVKRISHEYRRLSKIRTKKDDTKKQYMMYCSHISDAMGLPDGSMSKSDLLEEVKRVAKEHRILSQNAAKEKQQHEEYKKALQDREEQIERLQNAAEWRQADSDLMRENVIEPLKRKLHLSDDTEIKDLGKFIDMIDSVTLTIKAVL